MTDKNPAGKTWRSYLLATALFIFCALPGLAAYLFSSLALSIALTGDQRLAHPLYLALTAIASIILLVIGAGKWGKWLYTLVFLPLPIILPIYFLLTRQGSGGKNSLLIPLFIAAFSMFLIHAFVRDYYERGKN